MNGLERVQKYFRAAGRKPFDFQLATWRAFSEGKSGLLQAPTGMGKTLAAAMGPIIDWLDAQGNTRDAGPKGVNKTAAKGWYGPEGHGKTRVFYPANDFVDHTPARPCRRHRRIAANH